MNKFRLQTSLAAEVLSLNGAIVRISQDESQWRMACSYVGLSCNARTETQCSSLPSH